MNADILVRDDGSKDKTVEILNKYQEENKLRWYNGENLRSAKSFMDLVRKSGEYQYYAFSDQDDYWKKNKLKRAIEQLKEYDNIPAIYFCQKEIVDENLKKMKYKNYNSIVSFETSLVRNIVTGCTMVINNKLMKILKEYTPEYIEMHDSWIYRVCLAVGGKAIFDQEENIMYRQHGNNVIGANESWNSKLKRRINSFIHNTRKRSKTVTESKKGYYNEMTEENKKCIDQLDNYNKSLKNKINIIKNKKFKTEDKERNFIFKIAILLNKF